MRVLLLNGGGIDSLAVAMLLKASEHDVMSLHVDLGYPNAEPCRNAAELIATTYCSSHKLITLNGLDAMGVDPAIDTRYRPIQYQQLVLSSIGCSHAQMNGITYVTSGFRHGFLTNEFKPRLNGLLAQVKLSYLNPILVEHPLAGLSGDDAVFGIIQNSPILHQTVSCLQLPACGVCSKCLLRAKYNI